MPFDPFELDRMATEVGGGLVLYGKLPPLCVECGYNLSGAVSERCPECGWVIQHRQLQKQASELRIRLIMLKAVPEWLNMSLGFAIGAVALVLLSIAFDHLGAEILRFFSRFGSFCSAIGATLLASSVIRIYTVPKWARERYDIRPNMAFVFLSIVLAAIAIGLNLIVF